MAWPHACFANRVRRCLIGSVKSWIYSVAVVWRRPERHEGLPEDIWGCWSFVLFVLELQDIQTTTRSLKPSERCCKLPLSLWFRQVACNPAARRVRWGHLFCLCIASSASSEVFIILQGWELVGAEAIALASTVSESSQLPFVLPSVRNAPLISSSSKSPKPYHPPRAAVIERDHGVFHVVRVIMF